MKVKYIVEQRGFPWSKWRKIKEYERHEHDWVYKEKNKRVCESCKEEQSAVKQMPFIDYLIMRQHMDVDLYKWVRTK